MANQNIASNATIDCSNETSAVQQPLTKADVDPTMPIAIIGMACRFPGEATSPEGLWQLCADGGNAYSKIPEDRFNQSSWYHPNGERRGTLHVKGGHFLKEGIARFDAPFFGINADEAKALDPQLRLQLESSYEAFENAGLPMEKISGSDTSVYSGIFTRDYHDSLMRDTETIPRYFVTGNGTAMLANRISYFFNLKGPSMTVDTGCSTSLVALHLACQSLKMRESKMSVVGGSNIILNPDMMTAMTNLGFLSPDGKSYAFDHRASGYGRGEGCASIILKPLEDALRDGDPIRAVIRQTALNQDGKTAGITLPSQEAQEELIRHAYKSVNLNPLETGYFECHGTGTKAGDPREAEALGAVLSNGRPVDNPLYIGSVKANIGHTEAASGLAGIIKSALSIEKGLIAPLAGFEKINPKVSLGKLRLKVPTRLEPWPTPAIRRASINSLGYGGTNAHVILENADQYMRACSPITSPISTLSGQYWQRRIFMLSARDEIAAKAMISNLAGFLEKHHGFDEEKYLNNLAYTLDKRRSRLPWIAATSATSLSELIATLKDAKLRPERVSQSPRLGFVFTGQGAQHYAMGRELTVYPVYRDTLRAADEYLQKLGAQWSLWDELHQDEKSSRVGVASISQPLCTALQIALVRLLDSWGIKASAVTGHSSGEIGAAYAAGVLNLEDAMTIAYFRGVLANKGMEKMPDLRGGMIAVGLGQEEAEKRIQTLKTGKVVVACVNSPSSVTVSGDLDAIDELKILLDGEKIFARKLKVDAAYHSHHMQLVAEDYHSHLQNISTPKELTTPIFSSVSGKRLESPSEIACDYWVRNMVQPVLFNTAVQDMAKSKCVDVLIEVGPHAALAGPIRQILTLPELKRLPITYTSCLVRKQEAVKTMQEMVCFLITKGYHVNLEAVNFPHGATDLQVLVDLPPYPWNHKTEIWYESRLNREHRLRPFGPHDLLGVPQYGSNPLAPTWRHFIKPEEIPWIRDHVVQSTIIYPGAGFVCMAIEAANQIEPNQDDILGFELTDVTVKTALVVPDDQEGVEVQLSLKDSCDKLLNGKGMKDFRVYSVDPTGKWTIHATGCIRTVRKPTTEAPSWKEGPKLGLPTEEFSFDNPAFAKTLDPKRLYKSLRSVGINHGPSFQNLTSVRVGKQRSLATVTTADTAALLPMHWEHSHIIHPTTLDAVFQAVYPAYSEKGMENSKTMVPSTFKSIFVAHDFVSIPNHQVKVRSTVDEIDPQGFTSSLQVVNEGDDKCRPVIDIQGFRCTSIGSSTAPQEVAPRKLCFQMLWNHDISFLKPGDFKNLVKLSVEESELAAQANLQRVSLYVIQDALKQLSDADRQNMKPHHQKLYDWLKLQADLGNQGKLQYQTSQWLQSPEEERQGLIREVSAASTNGEMLCRIGKNLARILKNQVEPLEVMLEDRLLYSYYEKALGLDRTYAQVGEIVDKYAHKYPNSSILEIGAGTGGCSLPVLKALGGNSDAPARFHTYDFTDISSGFFEAAREKFGAWGDRVNFKKFNVELDPASQGFELGSYDLIVACRVLHATQNMDKTMNHVRQLLKPTGKLLLIEGTRDTLETCLIFGTLPGWWLSEEPERAWSPQLTCEQWEKLLNRNSFSGVDACVQDHATPEDHIVSVILSSAVAPAPKSNTYPEVVIVSGESEQSKALAGSLKASLAGLTGQGQEPTIVKFDEVEGAGKICLFINELDDPVLDKLSSEQFLRLRQVLTSAKGIFWVTCGGAMGCEKPHVSLVTGLFRTLRSENRGVRYATLDLEDVQEEYTCKNAVESITTIFGRSFGSAAEDEEPDLEFAIRDGLICIPRILEDRFTNNAVTSETTTATVELQKFVQPGRPLRIEVGTPGLLDTLRFVDDVAAADPLPKGFVEVEPKAFGLNFRDVMTAMGQLNETFLGCEASGIVTRVASDVTSVKAGDKVCMMMRGNFGNLVRITQEAVCPIPNNLSFEMAASVPIIFTTAYYSLYDLAKLEKGETVLIHSAAGGVGQAAIMLAQRVGAEIYATVGSQEKKESTMEMYGIPGDHIFYSRDASFAKDIMAATKGKGVDVVLNSLAGNLLEETWKCISPCGRFIEIGARDMVLHSRLDLAQFSRNASFHGVNLIYLLQYRPKVYASVIANVMDLMGKNEIKPVGPISVLPISELERALRMMQAGKHRGKLVIVPHADDLVKALPAKRQIQFRDDAAYMIVGGVGGIGRSLAHWMAKEGAKHLVLTSRSAETSANAADIKADLAELGCECTLLSSDVTKLEDLSAALAKKAGSIPPIRGVIQAAMVLRDCIFEHMSYSQYMEALRPKVQGTWNLHESFKGEEVDFFVMLSSLVGVSGHNSQANYGAGGAFLDAIARYRTAHGYPAVCLDLGIIESVGFVSENEDIGVRLAKQGYIAIHEEEMIAMVKSAIMDPRRSLHTSQVVTGVGASKGKESELAQDPRFSALLELLGPQSEKDSKAKDGLSLKAQLLAISATDAAERKEEAVPLICKAIVKKLSEDFMIPESDIDENEPIVSYGVDSLVAVELRNWLLSQTKAEISVFDVLQSKSLIGLAETVASKSVGKR